jgi:hypothetical protein
MYAFCLGYWFPSVVDSYATVGAEDFLKPRKMISIKIVCTACELLLWDVT